MALSRNYKLCLILSTLLSLVSLTSSLSGGYSSREEMRKMVLGSRPPGCVNKCISCRPCEATLVIPSHQNGIKWVKYQESSSHRDDGSYYLLSWKCRCGNKLYQP